MRFLFSPVKKFFFSISFALLFCSIGTQEAATSYSSIARPLLEATLFAGATTLMQWAYWEKEKNNFPNAHVDWHSLIFCNVNHALRLLINYFSKEPPSPYPHVKASWGVTLLGQGIKLGWGCLRAKLLLNAHICHNNKSPTYFSLVRPRETASYAPYAWEIFYLLSALFPSCSLLHPLTWVTIMHELGHYSTSKFLSPETVISLSSLWGLTPQIIQSGRLPTRTQQCYVSAAGGIVGGLTSLLLLKGAALLPKLPLKKGSLGEKIKDDFAANLSYEGKLSFIRELDHLFLPWRCDSRNLHHLLGLTPGIGS